MNMHIRDYAVIMSLDAAIHYMACKNKKRNKNKYLWSNDQIAMSGDDAERVPGSG